MRYRVLLVEDNELDARSIAKALTNDAQCTIEHVADLTSAIDTLRSAIFDCILLDLSLPDSEGLVSVETVLARAPNIPIVVLTGLDDPEMAVEAVRRGAQDYLVKNQITPALITRALRYAVTRHSNDLELREVHSRLADMNSREQIARDLHDTVIQRLFATGMSLQAAATLTSHEAITERAQQAVDQIDDAIRELRQAIFGLNSLDETGLLVNDLVRLVDSYGESLGFDPVVQLGELPTVPATLRHDILATVRESLSNIAKHAAASHTTVSVLEDEGSIVVRVVDNGRGIESARGQAELSGNGLRNMRQRAEAHGGKFTITSSVAGTKLIWNVPIPNYH